MRGSIRVDGLPEVAWVWFGLLVERIELFRRSIHSLFGTGLSGL